MSIVEYLDSLRKQFRSRTVPSVEYSSAGYQAVSGTKYFQYGGPGADGMAQETLSLENPHWHWSYGRAGDIGGPFFTRKVSLRSNNHIHTLGHPYGSVFPNGLRHHGALFPSYGGMILPALARDIQRGKMKENSTWTSDNSLSRGNLRAEGLKLMTSAAPSSPAYSLANSLGELIAEGGLFGIPIKQIIQKGEGGGLPGEYLNLQFGILPVVSDIKGYLEASRESERIIAQYRRDANKQIHRKRVIPTSVTSSEEEYTQSHANGVLIALPSQVLSGGLHRNGKLHVKRRTTRDIWFQGVFRYYFPEQAGDFMQKLLERNAVYGYLPSPETIWELTPFSWLTDWLFNTADIVESMFGAGVDGSVLVRGYVMCKTHVKTEYTWTGELNYPGGSWRSVRMSWVVEETIKQRERSRPYGLDWKLDGLTPKQLSILTALGLSRR